MGGIRPVLLVLIGCLSTYDSGFGGVFWRRVLADIIPAKEPTNAP